MPARSGMSRLQVVAVVALAALSLSTSVPNYLYMAFPLYGAFGFWADENWRVQVLFGNSTALKVGDVIDWRSLPFSKRYNTDNELFRWSRPGTKIIFPVIRNGVRYSFLLVSQARQAYLQDSARYLWLYGVKKSAELLIILLAAALAFIRPSRLSWSFFLFAAALAADPPVFWSFLPAGVYVAFSSVASVLAFVLPPLALIALGLQLFEEKPKGWQATLLRTTPFLLVIFALVQVAAILREAFAIFPGAWLVGASEWMGLLAWALSVAVLSAVVVRGLQDPRWALNWACIALAVSALCYLYIDVASRFDLLSTPFLRNALATLSLLMSLAAAYFLLRGRIIDVRFVITRAALFAVFAYLVVATFALLNLAFATRIAEVAYIIPIEIVIAVVFGFWLSGLQDIAAALNLAEMAAPAALVRGDRSSARDMLTRAIVRAERTRNPTLIATVRAHAAFAAWFAGDDSEFEGHAGALREINPNKPTRGLRQFARATCRMPAGAQAEPGALPEWSARTHLVHCGFADSVIEARRHAALALESADASDVAFLYVIASVALAEFSPEQRDGLYGSAKARCQEARLANLEQAVKALADAKKDLGLLEAFVFRRLRIKRPLLPMLDIRFADASIRTFGRPVELPSRELAMLLMIARDPNGMELDRLVDQLWPDLDGDGARSALRQTLYRMRKSLGDHAALVRSGPSYRVSDGAVVDLWEMKAIVESCRPGTLDDQKRRRLTTLFEAVRAGQASRPTQQDWFVAIEREITRLKRDAGLLLAEDALQRSDGQPANVIARALIEDGPLDEMPRGIAIRAYLAAGDRTSAVYEYEQYVDLLARASLGSPQADLTAIVAEYLPVG